MGKKRKETNQGKGKKKKKIIIRGTDVNKPQLELKQNNVQQLVYSSL